jgi:polysaccharide export outer membrane protein
MRQIVSTFVLVATACAAAAFAQAPAPAQPRPAQQPAAPAAVVDVPAEYLIGPEDVLGIVFWRDTEMTGDVTVRPDGKITLPLIGDIHAAGLSTVALKSVIEKAASKLQQDPSVTVVVKQINSLKVFITGQVANPGTFPLAGPRTVMQLISLAGGVTEYADKKHITVLRLENGRQQVFKFNYNDVAKGKNLAQNIVLKPGDTVVVP